MPELLSTVFPTTEATIKKYDHDEKKNGRHDEDDVYGEYNDKNVNDDD